MIMFMSTLCRYLHGGRHDLAHRYKSWLRGAFALSCFDSMHHLSRRPLSVMSPCFLRRMRELAPIKKRAVFDMLFCFHPQHLENVVLTRLKELEVSQGCRLDGDVADHSASLHSHGSFAHPSAHLLRTTSLAVNCAFPSPMQQQHALRIGARTCLLAACTCCLEDCLSNDILVARGFNGSTQVWLRDVKLKLRSLTVSISIGPEPTIAAEILRGVTGRQDVSVSLRRIVEHEDLGQVRIALRSSLFQEDYAAECGRLFISLPTFRS